MVHNIINIFVIKYISPIYNTNKQKEIILVVQNNFYIYLNQTMGKCIDKIVRVYVCSCFTS